MMKLFLVCRSVAFTLILGFVPWSRAAAPLPDKTQSLVDAVQAFNEASVESWYGARRAPLTEAEVIAAIQREETERSARHLREEELAGLVTIARTRRLPDGWKVDSDRGLIYQRTLAFEVWWPGLEIPRENGLIYRFPVRQRAVWTRMVGKAEQAIIEEWDRPLPEGRRDWSRYDLERQIAARTDGTYFHDLEGYASEEPRTENVRATARDAFLKHGFIGLQVFEDPEGVIWIVGHRSKAPGAVVVAVLRIAPDNEVSVRASGYGHVGSSWPMTGRAFLGPVDPAIEEIEGTVRHALLAGSP